MLLVVDNGSIYTKNITGFVQNKVDFVVKPFEKVNLSELEEFDSFIISGRRQNSRLMNAQNSKIILHAVKEKKPLLGICYGAEILAITLGGTVKKMSFSHKGEDTVNVVKENPLCSGEIRVFQSHNFEVANLGKSLIQVASSAKCKYEIIQHVDLSIFGTQFHPEMSQDGLGIIGRFILLS